MALLWKNINILQTPKTDLLVGEGYFIFPVFQFYEGEKRIIWPER